jgi:hypothetical protein
VPFLPVPEKPVNISLHRPQKSLVVSKYSILAFGLDGAFLLASKIFPTLLNNSSDTIRGISNSTLEISLPLNVYIPIYLLLASVKSGQRNIFVNLL